MVAAYHEELGHGCKAFEGAFRDHEGLPASALVSLGGLHPLSSKGYVQCKTSVINLVHDGTSHANEGSV